MSGGNDRILTIHAGSLPGPAEVAEMIFEYLDQHYGFTRSI